MKREAQYCGRHNGRSPASLACYGLAPSVSPHLVFRPRCHNSVTYAALSRTRPAQCFEYDLEAFGPWLAPKEGGSARGVMRQERSRHACRVQAIQFSSASKSLLLADRRQRDVHPAPPRRVLAAVTHPNPAPAERNPPRGRSTAGGASSAATLALPAFFSNSPSQPRLPAATTAGVPSTALSGCFALVRHP